MSQSVITIHLVEGVANKLHTAEIAGWIGQIIVAPKLELSNLLQRPEVQGLGIYVLIGDDPQRPDRKQIYVGQGNVTARLNIHNKDATKVFWDDKVVVIVAKDGSLNAAHCLHIESRLIELAAKADFATSANKQTPPLPPMYAPDKAIAENFLENIRVLLPVLRVDYFTPPLTAKASSVSLAATNAGAGPGPVQTPTFHLNVGNASAEALLINDDFVVKQGAIINPAEGALSKSYSTLRASLQKNGMLAVDQQTKVLTLTQDVVFASPSAAAAVICGYNINGPQNWKVKGTQQTYRDWDQARASAVTPTTPASPPDGSASSSPGS